MGTRQELRLTEEQLVKMNRLDLFPRSLDEYSSLKGKKYEIMDTGKQKKFVYFNPDWIKSDVAFAAKHPIFRDASLQLLGDLILDGCEALVRYVADGSRGFNYGIPVRIKS
jgi:hypothetical protein